MLYAGSTTLQGLGFVVMDEVHYLADRFRGPVWEEVIIHLTDDVQLVSLSATVSNAEEFGDWLAMVRGDTDRRGQRAPAGPARPARPGTRRPARPVRRPRRPDRARRRPADQPRPRRTCCGAATARRRGQPRRGTAATAAGGRGPAADGPGGGRPTPRFAVVDALDRDGLLPGDRLHLLPRRVPGRRRSSAWRPGVRLTTPAGGGRDPPDRGGALRGRAARGPRRARLLGVQRRPAARGRRAPRRHAAAVQGDRRGPVLARPGQGRVRHRDARARHQHARAVRGAGEAGQVGRLEPRRRHAGGVHAAHRARRAGAGSTSRATRSSSTTPASTRCAGRPRVQAAVPAALELPADLQHGRQPRRAGGPGPGARGARDVLRAVPGRPRRGRPRAAGTGARRGPGGVRRGDGVPPGRLRGVRARCGARSPPARRT